MAFGKQCHFVAHKPKISGVTETLGLGCPKEETFKLGSGKDECLH